MKKFCEDYWDLMIASMDFCKRHWFGVIVTNVVLIGGELVWFYWDQIMKKLRIVFSR